MTILFENFPYRDLKGKTVTIPRMKMIFSSDKDQRHRLDAKFDDKVSDIIFYLMTEADDWNIVFEREDPYEASF